MSDPRVLTVDDADLWPRYYFYLVSARLEIRAWLRERKQDVAGEDFRIVEARP